MPKHEGAVFVDIVLFIFQAHNVGDFKHVNDNATELSYSARGNDTMTSSLAYIKTCHISVTQRNEQLF